MCLEVENRENELMKNAFPCLLDTNHLYVIGICLAYFGHFSMIPVGCACRFCIIL